MERKYQIFTALQIVAVGCWIWVLITWHTPWNAQRYAGTVLSIAGLSGIVVARRQLGRSFSLTPQARQLVTSGIYSKVRNPIYVFGTVALAGLTMVFQKRELWIIVVCLAIAQTMRARREAGVLEAAFGDEYREYRRKTWF